MRIDILTLFPEIASAPLGSSIIGKAQERGLVEIRVHNLRQWATDKHRTTDDTPYGGSQGMVMKCEPFFAAVEALRQQAAARPGEQSGLAVPGGNDEPPLPPTAHTALSSTPPSGVHPAASSPAGLPAQEPPPAASPLPQSQVSHSRIVLLSPGGRPFSQKIAEEYARLDHLILLSGHYEGIDQRVHDHLADEELSIGDYVLTNGTLAAAVVTDAVVRLLPGVLGDAQSAPDDSFSSGLLEFPQYTRPVEFRGWRVPDILLSGNHGAIARWRREQALAKTRRVRPDLLDSSNTP